MSSDLQIALIAALVGGGLAMLGSVLQHFLSLREDRISRERDEEQRAAAQLRRSVLQGTDFGAEQGLARDVIRLPEREGLSVFLINAEVLYRIKEIVEEGLSRVSEKSHVQALNKVLEIVEKTLPEEE